MLRRYAIVQSRVDFSENSCMHRLMSWHCNPIIKSLLRLITFFLGIPYRLISFLTIYKVLLTSLSIRVYFYIGVAIGVIGRTYLVRVLLAVVVVYKVGI